MWLWVRTIGIPKPTPMETRSLSASTGNGDEPPNYSETEICVVGRDLTEFSVVRYGSFIRTIDLSYNLLMKLRGLEGCAGTLEELVLDNNQFIRLDLKGLFPKLHTLSLNKNRISNLTVILKELSAKTPNLRYLSLLGNPVCPHYLLSDAEAQETEYAAYRCHILNHLIKLRFLDHRIVTSDELAESQKVTYQNITTKPHYTPLPVSTSVLGTPRESCALSENNDADTERQPTSADAPRRKGRQGRRRFKYVGKNSEGNRFIKDSDL